jgi:hypothetical protein
MTVELQRCLATHGGGEVQKVAAGWEDAARKKLLCHFKAGPRAADNIAYLSTGSRRPRMWWSLRVGPWLAD